MKMKIHCRRHTSSNFSITRGRLWIGYFYDLAGNSPETLKFERIRISYLQESQLFPEDPEKKEQAQTCSERRSYLLRQMERNECALV